MEKINFNIFKQILAENLGITLNEINRSSSFRDDFRIDSLSVVNFLLKIEKKFKIKIDTENMMKMDNINNAYTIINKLIQERKT